MRIVWLSEPANVLVQEVGGKALSLLKLSNAGHSVPPGFIIPVGYDVSKYADAIVSAFKKLGASKVAVRSSAVAEDGSTNSWAGQFESFLNVDSNNLLNRVNDCHKSAHSERAQAYASRFNKTPDTRVAVVVQAMVESRIAGVGFSVHPISADADRVVIEASKGLGEQVVSGTVTPDTFIIDASTGKVIEAHGDDASLTVSEVRKLCRKIKSIERFYGHPVDVEWAITKDTIWILQARPITALVV